MRWLWLVVRLAYTRVVLVQGALVFKPPSDHTPVKSPGIQHKVVDIGLPPFPELGWAVFAKWIHQSVGMNHKYVFVRHRWYSQFLVSVPPCSSGHCKPQHPVHNALDDDNSDKWPQPTLDDLDHRQMTF